MDNAVKVLFDKLMQSSERVKKAAEEMEAALDEAASLGIETRSIDVDMVQTRFKTQIPYQLAFRAGGLLPPITGTLIIRAEESTVESA